MRDSFLIAILLLVGGCITTEKISDKTLSDRLSGVEKIESKPQYLESPYVTAGNRVYMIGHQDGSFPPLGWHIQGEMGGIWDHPIKLMDGFVASIGYEGKTFCLNKASQFANFPMANQHTFVWEEENISAQRVQFVPDSLEAIVIEFSIENNGTQAKEISFSFTGLTDLRPTWLGERTGMADGDDEIRFDEKRSLAIAKDVNNSWFTVFGSSNSGEFSSEAHCDIQKSGVGTHGTLAYSFSIQPNEKKVLTFAISGSMTSEEDAINTWQQVIAQKEALLAKKIKYYEEVSDASRISIPDEKIEQMYRWLTYNTEWLVRTVPSEGTGLSAGLPDYPWWFGCDNTYALQGILATGNHELVRNTIQLLSKISERTNGNGRIVHEVSTNGAVYNPGNVNETAQFITLVWNYLRWTGDKAFVETLYPQIDKGIVWLTETQDPDRNGYPNGSGMMEIHGLDTEMIDVAVYTQQALESAGKLATALDKPEAATRYAKMAATLQDKINKEWWQPISKSFGDFRGTRREATPVLEAALIRADTLEKPWAVAELKETRNILKQMPADKPTPHVIYHNWVVNTPMETGIADTEKAEAAFVTASRYENPFGMYVTGIDRTEEADSVVLNSRKKTFSYVGAVMTLPTGVQAVGSARYGKPDLALSYIKKLEQSFSFALPGSMYEVSPDFGMMTQAWNNYGVAVPIVEYFFGIKPEAHRHIVTISPDMPADWDDVAIKHVKMGDNVLSIEYLKDSEKNQLKVSQRNDWKIYIEVSGDDIEINGESISSGDPRILEKEGRRFVVMSEKESTIRY